MMTPRSGHPVAMFAFVNATAGYAAVMTMDTRDLYARASEWTLDKVRGATDKLDARTPMR